MEILDQIHYFVSGYDYQIKVFCFVISAVIYALFETGKLSQ